MAIKNFSSRIQICGRSGKCHGGHSAVEQSSYISRTTMYCEFDGQTYYPKYSEDLVDSAVLLPEFAPDEYNDPSVLWNAVEMNEKSSDAQLARTIRFQLPNDWSYVLAKDVVKSFCQREFVDKGMCCQYAIHDSENKGTGQRNLHVHILLTMRGIDENGQWLPKQKKIYLTDENGNRIPLIDKSTKLQKVDKQNRKQWKCKTVHANDWSSRESAKIWRKDFVDTLNAINERIGRTDNFWEYRSFKEQSLDIEPQVHLGEKASALERAGIRTLKGDINREIIAHNAIIMKAKETYEQAKENLASIKDIPVQVVKVFKNEILDMIREVTKRNNGRLKLPILKGKYLAMVSDRASLQNKEKMEAFVHEMGFTTFDEMREFRDKHEKIFNELSPKHSSLTERVTYLQSLLYAYRAYEPYIKYHKEQWAIKGFARKQYERKHITELANYDINRNYIKSIIKEPDKKITPKAWRDELETLQKEFEAITIPFNDTVIKLAAVDVFEHNRKELERMLRNESRASQKLMVLKHKHREDSL